MVEVAQAGFFCQLHSANSQRKQSHIRSPGGCRHECTPAHGHAYANTPTPDEAELPLSSERRCTHTAAATRVKSQLSCLSTSSGWTLSKSTHMSTFVHPGVFCVWLWFNRWAPLVLLYCSIYLNSSLSPGLQWCGRASPSGLRNKSRWYEWSRTNTQFLK